MSNPRKTISKEHKAWMKESGYTEEQLDFFWEACYFTNKIVMSLTNSGHSWRDLNLSALKDLPNRKEKDLEAKKQRELEAERLFLEKEKKRQEEEYRLMHYEEIIVGKIDNGEKLTEEEMHSLLDYEIDRDEGENRRWSQSIFSVVELCGRTFGFTWERGLTEYQDDEFYSQPYEVELHEYEKIVVVKDWKKVKKTEEKK